MSQAHDPDSQFDFFIPTIVDLKWRDQQDTMERPFFSLSKSKRLKPIEYQNKRDGVFVKVEPHQTYGMATIWDADILIWAASVITEFRNQKVNDIPRKLSFQPYDLLKAIGRGTSGAQYERLREGLERLKSTQVRTNIRSPGGKKETHFSWIEGWSDLTDPHTKKSLGMQITVSDWFYEGVTREAGVLSIDAAYFQITGGRERWLYRVARKHAGGAGGEGFTIGMRTLFEKSGAEGDYRRFKFEITKIVRGNTLPGYALFLDDTAAEPKLRMVRREMVSDEQVAASRAKAAKPRPRTKAKPKDADPQGSIFAPRGLTEETIQRIRKDFSGWDVYALQAEFNDYLAGDPSRAPRDYNAAFYGFVKRYHETNRHQLR